MIIIKAMYTHFLNVSGNVLPICFLPEIPQLNIYPFCVHIIENARENTLSDFSRSSDHFC